MTAQPTTVPTSQWQMRPPFRRAAVVMSVGAVAAAGIALQWVAAPDVVVAAPRTQSVTVTGDALPAQLVAGQTYNAAVTVTLNNWTGPDDVGRVAGIGIVLVDGAGDHVCNTATVLEVDPAPLTLGCSFIAPEPGHDFTLRVVAHDATYQVAPDGPVGFRQDADYPHTVN